MTRSPSSVGRARRLLTRGLQLTSGRQAPAVTCKAPFSSMYLDQRGNVRACCMNDRHVLGNIADTPLLDIWHGSPAGELRSAMTRHDLTLGCDFCQWRVEQGRPDLAHLRWFEQFDVGSAEPAWPQQIEFSISNTCNLRCAMCNGEWSSSIRSQREGLPPLPKVYGDAFFDELRLFLPHLESAKFLGGEPFLAAETLRVMEAMVEVGATARCHVTTNGTQWSPRVERILDLMPVDVALSLDAATAESYHQIRVGSDWDTVLLNLDRFQEHAAARGTGVTLTFCLMRTNAHELFDFCRLADRRGIGCTVNTVTTPVEMSLYQLDVDELATVLTGLEAQGRQASDLTLSRAPWDGELDRLRAQLRDRQDGRSVVGLDVRSAEPVSVRGRERDPARIDLDVAAVRRRVEPLLLEHVGRDPVRIELDGDGVVRRHRPDGSFLGIDGSEIIGRPATDLTEVLGARFGGVDGVDRQDLGDDLELVDVRFGDGTVLPMVVTPDLDDDRPVAGAWLHVGVPVRTGGSEAGATT